MARIVNFSPSPDTILPAELNGIQDDYEAIVRMPNCLLYATTSHTAAPVTYADGIVGSGDGGANGVVANSTGDLLSNQPTNGVMSGLMYFDPALYVSKSGLRNVRLRMNVGYLRTSTQTAVTTTFTLRRMTQPPFPSGPPTAWFDPVPGLVDTDLVVSVPPATASGAIVTSEINASGLVAAFYVIEIVQAGTYAASSDDNFSIAVLAYSY